MLYARAAAFAANPTDWNHANFDFYTVIAKGGSNPNEWLDVVVNIGTQGNNAAPVISNFTVSNPNPATGQVINFAVTATDPDGDPLAYHWDVGDNTVQSGQLNKITRAKLWNSAGYYVVRLEVSDIKGGKTTTSAVIRVGTTTNRGMIRGRVTHAGRPVEGAFNVHLNSASLTNATSVAINAGSLVVATSAANAIGGIISFGGGNLQFNNPPGSDYSLLFSTAASQPYRISVGSTHEATFNSNLASPGGTLTKLGTGTLVLAAANSGNFSIRLSGNNTYSGETHVVMGTLMLTENARIPDTSAVCIESGAVLHLDFTGSDTVGVLILGGVAMPVGTYGSPASASANRSADFAGTGILQDGDAYTYETWAASQSPPVTGGPNPSSLGGMPDNQWREPSKDFGSPGNRDVVLDPSLFNFCQRCTNCCKWQGDVSHRVDLFQPVLIRVSC